jgi:hypothetical protein
MGMNMMLAYVTVGILLLGALCALAIFLKKRTHQNTGPLKTYSGAIRATGHDGRNLKIVQKGDGSFEMEEEEPPSR